MAKRTDPTNAERQRRYRANQKKLRERYVTGAGIDPAPIRSLLKEIIRRRKEVGAPRLKGYWNPDPISKLELTQILDWIEDELADLVKPAIRTG